MTMKLKSVQSPYTVTGFFKKLIMAMTVLSICGMIYFICFSRDYYGTIIQRTFTRNESLDILKDKNSKDCKPKTKIGFPKLHKTGSSTIQSVLLLYGLKHGLNVVLPVEGNNIKDQSGTEMLFPIQGEWLSTTVPWHDDMVHNHSYDIMALHAIWNHNLISELLGPHAIYFTIIRQPLEQFQSMYSFFDLKDVNGMDMLQYLQALNASDTLRFTRYSGLGLNHQLYCLGLGFMDCFDMDRANKLIENIDKLFDLVLIFEYFDESLVLLADLLCWPLEDVVNFKRNSIIKSREYESRSPLLPHELMQAFHHWQAPDLAMYDYFYDKFWKRIEAYGRQRLKQDVEKLRHLRKEMEIKCDVKSLPRDELIRLKKYSAVPYSNKTLGFLVRDDISECILLATSELALIDIVREAQIQRWKAWNSTNTSEIS